MLQVLKITSLVDKILRCDRDDKEVIPVCQYSIFEDPENENIE